VRLGLVPIKSRELCGVGELAGATVTQLHREGYRSLTGQSELRDLVVQTVREWDRLVKETVG
jgi:hypothetical protein